MGKEGAEGHEADGTSKENASTGQPVSQRHVNAFEEMSDSKDDEDGQDKVDQNANDFAGIVLPDRNGAVLDGPQAIAISIFLEGKGQREEGKAEAGKGSHLHHVLTNPDLGHFGRHAFIIGPDGGKEQEKGNRHTDGHDEVGNGPLVD